MGIVSSLTTRTIQSIQYAFVSEVSLWLSHQGEYTRCVDFLAILESIHPSQDSDSIVRTSVAINFDDHLLI